MADDELCREIKRQLSAWGNGAAVGETWTYAEIDERQLSIAVVGDPRMFGGDTCATDANVTIGTRTDGD